MPEDYSKKLQTLLRKLFQFESADLDFGIYRIMNRKRDVIEKFIEKDLLASVDAEFGKISETTKGSVKKELDELKNTIEKTLGSSAILPSGEFDPQYANTPIGSDLAKQYKEKTLAYGAASVSDEHKAEVFNHIYQFFSRYYDNGDFMSMRRYSVRQKFAVPYNGEEVLLHWANKDQYYIKTGEYFFNYAFRVGEYTVRFQIVQAETAMNNTKAENRFFILHSGEGNVTYDEKSKELVILFQYRALTEAEKAAVGTRNVQDALNEQEKTAILAAIPDVGLRTGLTRESDGKNLLLKHLATYARRNTTDYFIHKNLYGFLTQELDFYIKNEMFDLDDLGTTKEIPVEQYLNRVRVMKAVSIKIITFLAQIEDFQKKLFEKKKFVMSTNYCMTLDRVPESFYAEIAKNKEQVAEWKVLYGIGEPGWQATLSSKENDPIDVKFLKSLPYLVLDTKFFSLQFKDRLLATFDDLDEATGGMMVKSENWQALNLLQERYRDQVKCIFIDPPYNTGSDEFVYKDGYQKSSWHSMIQDRIGLARRFLSNTGSQSCTIDKNEDACLRFILDYVYGPENFVANIAWQKLYTIKNSAHYLSEMYDSILVYTKDKISWRPNLIPRSDDQDDAYGNPDNDPNGPWISNALQARNYYSAGIYSIKCPGGRAIEGPPPGTYWRSNEKSFWELDKQGRVWWGKDKNGFPRIKTYLKEVKEGVVPVDYWLHQFAGTNAESKTETRDLVGIEVKGLTPKPVLLLTRILEMNGDNDCIILDYFAGSGTTAHAALNLNRRDNGSRRYIVIEMGNYFHSVLKPRIQKVIYSSEWKDGKPKNTDGISHMFKYLTLEQYEDTLNNIDFMEGGTVQKTLLDMDGYVLRYMLDFETRESPCRMNTTKLERPFEYTLRITKDSELQDETVDLVETFNYLLGLKVKRIRTFAENRTTYRVVHGETLSGQGTTVIWRTTVGLDLKSDKAFIEEKILTDPKLKAERIFINGDFHVEGALPIEPEFQRLMGA